MSGNPATAAGRTHPFRHLATVIAISLFLLSMVGCGRKAESPPAATETESPSVLTPQELVPITVGALAPPSLGAFLLPIIEQNKFDEANGLTITFDTRPATAYKTAYAAGEIQVGASAGVLDAALAAQQGVKHRMLFSTFDFWGTVITEDPAIQSLADLKGKKIAAATVTTNYVMFQYFAQAAGLNMDEVEVINTGTSGLVTYATARRADAVQLWEPAYTVLITQEPERFHIIDYAQDWAQISGVKQNPYLGVAAHDSWIEQNRALVPQLYATFTAAAEWVEQNPDAASRIVAKAFETDEKAMLAVIESGRLGLNVMPYSEMLPDLKKVFEAGMMTSYLTAMPSDDLVYQW